MPYQELNIPTKHKATASLLREWVFTEKLQYSLHFYKTARIFAPVCQIITNLLQL